MTTLARTAAAVAVACTMIAGPALAQPAADAEARALALFKEAVAALDRHDYAAACPRFDAAMALYASPSTQINIARCLEHDGKIASAWAAYQRAIVLNRDTLDPRRRAALDKVARDASSAIEPRLPRLRIVAQGAPPGLRVKDGPLELPSESLGIALPTDPGPHEITASAPGYEDLHVSVTAEKGKQTDVPIALKASPGPPPGAAAEPGPSPSGATPASSGAGKAPAWAWAAGGVGIAALGVAAGFGAAALGKQGAIEAACGAQFPRCPKDAQTMSNVNALVDTRNLDRGVFIGLAAAGAVGLVAGIVGIATAGPKKDEKASARVIVAPFGGPGGAGLVVEGRL